jgi:hypothetical protein
MCSPVWSIKDPPLLSFGLSTFRSNHMPDIMVWQADYSITFRWDGLSPCGVMEDDPRGPTGRGISALQGWPYDGNVRRKG